MDPLEHNEKNLSANSRESAEKIPIFLLAFIYALVTIENHRLSERYA